MIRTIVVPEKSSISFDIPKEYIGKQIEIIAFAKDEGLPAKPLTKKVSFTALAIDTLGYKFDRDEANER